MPGHDLLQHHLHFLRRLREGDPMKELLSNSLVCLLGAARVLAQIALLTTWVGIASGQGFQSGEIRSVSLPSSPMLRVVLPAGISDWSVSARVSNSLPASIFAVGSQSDSEMMTCESCVASGNRKLSDLAASVSVRGEVVELVSSGSSRIGLLVTLRPGQKLTVLVDHREYDLTPDGVSKQVVNGTASDSPKSFQKFLAEFAMPPRTKGMLDFDRDGLAFDGKHYYSTPRRMKSRLVKFELPKVVPPPTERSVQLLLEVDAVGKVRSLDRNRAINEFEIASHRAVLNWEFRPVLRDGQAIAVRVPVVFVFRPDGEVRSVGF